jgi:hypothetical protein
MTQRIFLFILVGYAIPSWLFAAIPTGFSGNDPAVTFPDIEKFFLIFRRQIGRGRGQR